MLVMRFVVGMFAVVLVAALVHLGQWPRMVRSRRSLKEALDDQAKQFEAATGNKVVVLGGASNTLAKQLEAQRLRTSSFGRPD
jgi:ABC-type molybdate transport system substrate-binding protein